jgi:RNA polymerase sigma-70 factor (ECF subfamily)
MSELSSLSSVDLLKRAQEGDREATDLLFGRYLPDLRRWASGRLPRWARDIADTTDLVQDTLLRTYRRMALLDPSRESTLRAYLRQAVLNQVRDEFRRRRRRPQREELEEDRHDEAPSPFDEAVGEELFASYEAALDRLSESERELIVSRVQLSLSYAEIAELTARPTANAARSAVVRALARLSDEMDRNG